MALGDKLSKLRKENNFTQEQLASVLGVSRQAISKWESNMTFPETDKLIRMSELFQCSLDYLLKDTEETGGWAQNDEEVSYIRKRLRERKSEKTVWGMPLWHIGKSARGFIAVGFNARGVIAIGLKAKGFISLGMLSIGIISLGMLSIGLLSIGMLALGILTAGCFSVGVLAAGAISLGVISLGAIAIGDFSVGAFAVGKYVAYGDHARAMIAVGESQAVGKVFQKMGELTAQEIRTIKELLDTMIPTYLLWAKEIVKLFL
ncbi:MAG: helix-turn-helix domain-containing protein [Lachnospiraceae bacterium]|nr:helix-turn-helix domain-containing protein [Lachnospiraceae bacterium]MDD7078831.1 helix-turn-helix transcriptional regulator [Lachnospiraceae bacterium]